MACVKVYHFQDEVVRGCSFPLPSVSALSQMTCSWGACESPSCCCSVTQPRPTLRNPTTAAHQASLPFTISWSLLKLMSIVLMIPSNRLILSCPQIFPASWSFPMSWLFASGGQSTGVSALASVLPMNIQGQFPLGWTGLIPLLSKGLSRGLSSTM